MHKEQVDFRTTGNPRNRPTSQEIVHMYLRELPLHADIMISLAPENQIDSQKLESDLDNRLLQGVSLMHMTNRGADASALSIGIQLKLI